MSSPLVLPCWLGRTDAPLAARVHLPATDPASEVAMARDAVILCPPVGRQQVATYRALRIFAERLAARGQLVVRFAWSGTSDSAPRLDDLGLLPNWDADLAAVVAQVRGWGIDRVHLAGFALGALVAARQARELDASSLLLVDPVTSGRQFLRREQVLYTTQELPETQQPGWHGLGFSLGEAEAAELRAARMGDDLGEMPQLRVVRGSGTDQEGVWVERKALEQALDAASMAAIVPDALLDRTADQLDAWSGDQVHPVQVNAATEAQFEVEVDGRRARVRESFLTLPHGVPAILTEPAERPGDLPVLYVASASEPMDGPTGLWAISARQQAAGGALALRIDKHGTGELGGPELRDCNPYLPIFIDDVGLAADWLTRRTGRRPVGVGMCSGAYLLMVGPNPARMARVVGVNQLAFYHSIEQIPLDLAMATGPGEEPDDSSGPTASRLGRLRSGARHVVKEHLPQPAWRRLGRVGLVHGADDFLREAAAATRLVLPFSPEDWAAARRQRVDRSLAWARTRGGPIRAWLDPGLDHALFGAESRARTLQLVTDEVAAERRRPS